MKHVLYVYPILTISSMLLFSLGIFTIMIYNLESTICLDPNVCGTLHYSHFNGTTTTLPNGTISGLPPFISTFSNQPSNAAWFNIITMTTVGYGDFVPKTHIGRGIAMLACFWGNFVLSLFVSTLSNSLSMTKGEKEAS